MEMLRQAVVSASSVELSITEVKQTSSKEGKPDMDEQNDDMEPMWTSRTCALPLCSPTWIHVSHLDLVLKFRRSWLTLYLDQSAENLVDYLWSHVPSQ